MGKQAVAVVVSLGCAESIAVQCWIDFSCISQSHETEKMQGIQSIPFYIGQCDYFVSMADT